MDYSCYYHEKHIHRQENKFGENSPPPSHWANSPLVFSAEKLKKTSLNSKENRVKSRGSTEHWSSGQWCEGCIMMPKGKVSQGAGGVKESAEREKGEAGSRRSLRLKMASNQNKKTTVSTGTQNNLEEPKQSWKRKMELEESGSLTSDCITKLQ